MMRELTIRKIAEVCNGTCYGPQDCLDTEITAVSTDSRKIEKGCLYVPIVGARADGHSFIPQVMEKGARVTLSEQDLGETDYPWIKVVSSLQAVKDLAEAYLKILSIPVVGITGSVGKTSTKEMIAAVLGEKYRVLKTLGNFNNELGLPLTVFRLRDEDEIAVLEMGISDFGEMTRLAKIARPKVSVITNIGWCHLENLKTRDGIFRAKTEMFDWLQKDGTVIVNGDDDKLCQIQEVQGKKPVFFGLNSAFPVWADQIEPMGLKGTRCQIHADGQICTVQIPLPGSHMVYNALAGTAVGLTFGMTLDQICNGIEKLKPLSGRFNILDLAGRVVVDDCYNANPVSMKASLRILEEGQGRRVAILGDMGELGENEAALHEEVGAFAGTLKIDVLYTVGTLTKGLEQKAREANPSLVTRHFATLDELLENLSALTAPGDTILVKASHFMHFEKIVEAFKSM